MLDFRLNMFWQCHISTFNKVKDLNTSSTSAEPTIFHQSILQQTLDLILK